MKNRIEEESSPKLVKITIELLPHEYEELKEMADYLGATSKQIVEALVDGQSEDYLGRKNDEIWSHLVEYIEDSYGTTPRLELVKRHLQACEANGDLPSPAERRTLWDRALQNADNYAAYLSKLARKGISCEQDKVVMV